MGVKKNRLIFRYFIFLIGLMLNGFGVAFITKASLGTTPIASLPYTLSLIFSGVTIGNFTIIISMLLIVLQVVILGRSAGFVEIILQVPISFIFGYVIDFSMWILTGFSPDVYWMKLVSLLIGCFIIACGAYLEVAADVTMLPADGFTRAIVRKTKKEFGTIKLLTDTSQAVLAAILGLIFLHTFAGVREGTVIGALLIGNIVKLLSKLYRPEHLVSDNT